MIQILKDQFEAKQGKLLFNTSFKSNRFDNFISL